MISVLLDRHDGRITIVTENEPGPDPCPRW